MDEENSVFAIIGILVLIPFVWMLEGWALSTLWRWFIVTQFHAVALTIPSAIGISIVFGLLKGTTFAAEDPKYKSFLTRVFAFIITPLFAVGCGWLVRMWL